MFSNRFLVGLKGKSSKIINYSSARWLTSSLSVDKPPEQQRSHEKTINQVTLLGRVGNEPLKKGSSEHPALIFSLATHNNYRYENGEFTEKTDWHRVCIFKPALRDLAFSYLRKGMRVYITGKISYGTVTDNEVTKAVTSIIAEDIVFLHHDGSS